MPGPMNKQELLKTRVEHISLDTFDPVPLVDAMAKMAFQARNTARAAHIYEMMLGEKDCAVILCLAGSLISAGLKRVIVQMLEKNMVDAIVSTGANIVDQDFFEGLGFGHWQGTPFIDDNQLRDLAIDRIYDTYIDEDELRICDDTCKKIADSLEPRPYSSREFIAAMGQHLQQHGKNKESIVLRAYEKGVPIFCPAFSDCSAGFGLVEHQYRHGLVGKPTMSLDSAKDFLELTRIKMASKETGLFMIGGGVPKNFAQDIVVSADILGDEAAMHKYAIQITVADERDGALSGSTLKEASSWGKVSTSYEQMVYGEATVFFPLIAGYSYHKDAAKNRVEKRFSEMLDQPVTAAD
ncbi:MAG: deoxyhypusine synthase [Planctomycetes bacterium]|nr:deoxyhypusine synthase [Planctomycetota bacterium]